MGGAPEVRTVMVRKAYLSAVLVQRVSGLTGLVLEKWFSGLFFKNK